jgi:hypothetical protein
MRLGKLTALTGVIIISVAIMFGCSDDDKTITPTITYGSLDDPEFVPVKTQIDATVTGVVSDILAGFDNLYVPPGDTSSVQNQLTPPAVQPDPDADPDVLIAIYENGWHFVYASYTGDIYYAEVKDSIRFEVDGVPVQLPTGQVDYIHYIDNWAFEALDQEVSHIDYLGRNDFELADLDQNVAVVNGNSVNNVETNYFAVDTTVTNLFAFEIAVTDINVPKVNGQWITGCPQSGTLVMVLTDTFEWTSGDNSGSGSINWEVEVIFDNGNATVTATNGETTWRYECEVCNIPS